MTSDDQSNPTTGKLTVTTTRAALGAVAAGPVSRRSTHRRDPFDPRARRVIRRTQIKGETRPAA
jgi:hypothetical protein